MNAKITFDTLSYAKKLIAVGFTVQQAEVQAETLAEIIDENIATKRDLIDVRNDLQRDMKEMEMRLSYKFNFMIALLVITLTLTNPVVTELLKHLLFK